MPSCDDKTVREIRGGDAALREDFIEQHRGFVQRYASFVCSRNLDWHNDDELSVALIAFNRAIDSYVPGRHRSFLHYARRVIRNGLIDHFRTTGPRTVSLDTTETGGLESAASWQRHLQDEQGRERAYEVSRLRDIVHQFGLTLNDLVRASPTHKDTREKLKSAALAVSSDLSVRDQVHATGRLPLWEIERQTGISRKVLDRWRRYLLSLILIATEAELEGLAQYVWGRRWTAHHGKAQGHCTGQPTEPGDPTD